MSPDHQPEQPDATGDSPGGMDTQTSAQPEGTPQGAESHAAVVAELEDRWRRAMADLDNLRKRYARELECEREAERERVAAAWLPILDNLDLALAHAEADPASIVEGVQAVRDQAVQMLANLGYPRHDEVGVPFDPAQHEAVSVVEDQNAEPGMVVHVMRPGYGNGERQLRPAAVAVNRQQE